METNTPTAQPKKTKQLLCWLVGGAAVILAFGGLLWQYLQLQDTQKQLAIQTANASEIAKENSTLKDQATVVTDTPAPTKDSTLILNAVDAYVRAPVAVAAEKFTYNITNNTGSFAKVAVTPSEGSGYSLTLKKVDANWTVLFGGQDLPLKDMAEKYGLPAGYYQE